MEDKQLIDVHVHSYYSLLDGVSSPAANVARAKEMGASAIGISDHGVVGGVFDHYWACKKAGVKAILGCELYLMRDVNDLSDHYFHAIVMAMNEVGFRNLLKLCSLGGDEQHYAHRRPCVSFDDIFKHSEGLLFSTACMIGITGISHKTREKIGTTKDGKDKFGKWQPAPISLEDSDNLYAKFKAHFGDRMFVEIGPARIDHDWSKKEEWVNGKKKVTWGFKLRQDNEPCLQVQHNRRAIYLARKHNIPIIISSDSHMCNPNLKKVQDILIKNTSSNGWHFHQTHALLTNDEVRNMFRENHPYVKQEWLNEAISNTHKLNDMIEDFTLTFTTHVPKYLKRTQSNSRAALMEVMKSAGRIQKFLNNIEYMRRLDEEIKVIAENGIIDYTDYFLILADIVKAAKDLDVGVGPARGSAGGCLLSYLLGITSIDPIYYNLSFVRFLNVGRLKSGHPPDIDIDFTDREPLIGYIESVYGKAHTASVGAYQTIKTKNALKDIARSADGGRLSADSLVHKICKTIDVAPQYYPSERDFLEGFVDLDGVSHPGIIESNKDLRDYLNNNPSVKGLLFNMLEIPRQLSKHAGGVVITSTPIDEIIPTRFWKGKKCTQVDFKTLEKLGGLKIDILGVNTLNWVWGAVKNIEDRHGVELDPWDLPYDINVFKPMANGITSTIFQFDTQVTSPFLKQLKPKNIEDLILITSVARPGCLDSKLEDGRSVADHFIQRKLGKEVVPTLNPLLAPIIGDTYGLFVFQEQIQKVFEVVGGLTPTESDDARRAIGKKDIELLLSIKKKLYDGAEKLHGWTTDEVDTLWHSFEGAANYAFNRAHATAYAVIAYACLYLKYHYNKEWWCAVLSSIDSDKIRAYLPEIDKDIKFPSVNDSKFVWTINDDGKLIPPLTLVRAVGDKAVAEIQKHSPFTSFEDFWSRVNKRIVNKAVIINLALTGCFSDIEGVDDTEQLLVKFFKLRKEDVPKEYRTINRPELIKERSRLLALASFNYVDEFRDIIKGGKQNGGTKWDYDVRQGFQWIDKCPIIEDPSTFEKFSTHWNKPICFIGMVLPESKMFYYKDRKTGAQVGAFRLILENNKQIVEMVIWPNTLNKLSKNDFEDGNLLAVFGELGYSSFKKATELKYSSHKRIL